MEPIASDIAAVSIRCADGRDRLRVRSLDRQLHVRPAPLAARPSRESTCIDIG